jgi:uncharacterized lipoprotein YbaY
MRYLRRIPVLVTSVLAVVLAMSSSATASTERNEVLDQARGCMCLCGKVFPPEGGPMEASHLLVEVRDVTATDDAPTPVIASREYYDVSLPADGMAFTLRIDTAKIDSSHTYAVSAVVHDSLGGLRMLTTVQNPVITQGNPVAGLKLYLKTV